MLELIEEQEKLEKSWNYYMNLYITLNTKPEVKPQDLSNLLAAINNIQDALNSVKQSISLMEQNLGNTEEVGETRGM